MLMVPSTHGLLGAGVAPPPVFVAAGGNPSWSAGSIPFSYPPGTQANDVVLILLEAPAGISSMSQTFAQNMSINRWSLWWKYCTGENSVSINSGGNWFDAWLFAYRGCFVGSSPFIITPSAVGNPGGFSGTATAPSLTANLDSCTGVNLFGAYSDTTSTGVTDGAGFSRRAQASFSDDVGLAFNALSDRLLSNGVAAPGGNVTVGFTSSGAAFAAAFALSALDPSTAGGGGGGKLP